MIIDLISATTALVVFCYIPAGMDLDRIQAFLYIALYFGSMKGVLVVWVKNLEERREDNVIRKNHRRKVC